MRADVFPEALERVWAGEINWTGDPMRMALLSYAAKPALTTWATWQDVEGEIEGPGYVAGGTLLRNTSAERTGGWTVAWNSSPVEWPEATLSAGFAVIYCDKGDQPLVLLLSFDRIIDSRRALYVVAPDVRGWFSATTA